MAKRCADCKHVIKSVDADDPTDVGYECAAVLPFWVPLPVADYGRWINDADAGARCAAFKPATSQ